MLLLTALAAAVAQTSPTRPALPSTFVRVERTKFPTLSGPCGSARTTFRVPSTRFPDIPSALATAKPFTRIILAAGVYIPTEPSWYPTLVNVKVDDICITGAGSGRTIIRAFESIDQAPRGIQISSNRVAISGMTIQGFLVGVYLGRGDGKTQRNITLTDINIIGWATPDRWSGGINAIPDHRQTKVPVLDGLLLSNVRVSDVIMGISCDYGPCEHWWLDNVTISCRGEVGWGADAFAIESGRQIVITGLTVLNAGGDGIDIKGSDAVVHRGNVINAGKNGIKLWRGGDVSDCVINGTGDWAVALSGTEIGRYRYQRLFITNHSKAGRMWLGGWGSTSSKYRVEFYNCIFKGNPNSGGFSVADGTFVRFVDNEFWDLGTRLLYYGDRADSLILMVDAEGLAEIVKRGWGSGNKLGGVTAAAALEP
eukprot:gene7525-7735_t